MKSKKEIKMRKNLVNNQTNKKKEKLIVLK